jgi:serine/threonine protein kinase
MTATCARCQAALEPDALEGLCPRCLLAQAVPLERVEEVATTPPGGFVPPAPGELAGLFPQLEVLELLGQGGMGAVYKARQVKLDRLVALKVLPPAAAGGPGFAERFEREARAMARLSHPNIVAVHDFGDAGGLYYLVMEFVEGANLRQAQAVGTIEPARALPLVAQLCSALQYAHEMGVVHRDVKPENILLDRRGQVKVADFGLAKLVGQTRAAARLTGTRQAMGTPHYMAPEQWERPLEVDHRADVYSLGVVFYELLTGELPLGKFAPPSARAGVDARLDQVVLRAIEKRPEQRYQHMSEMRSAVDSVEKAPPRQDSTELFGCGEWGTAMVFGAVTAVIGMRVWYLWDPLDLGSSLGFLSSSLVGIPLFAAGSLLGLFLGALLKVMLSAKRTAAAEEARVLGLTAQEDGLRRLLIQARERDLLPGLSVLPDIDGELLADTRRACKAGPDDRGLGILKLDDGGGDAALLFGCQGVYWRNAEGTSHPGSGSVSYAELAGRRFVNHGSVVYLGKDQFLCPNEEETNISAEQLTGFLYQVRDLMAAAEERGA